MSFALADWFGNVVGSAYYAVSGGAQTQATSDALDAQISALNAQEVQKGMMTQQQYDAAQADIAKGNASTGV